jgi:putative DNA primase/helicase
MVHTSHPRDGQFQHTSPAPTLFWDDDGTSPKSSQQQPAIELDNITVPEQAVPTNRRLLSLNLEEFALAKTVPREYILNPILIRQGLTMVHAKRGVGKTYFALGCALAAASGGSLLKWKAPEPRRVLYIDGEMPAAQMQERIEQLRAGLREPIDAERFRIINADHIGGLPPNLSSPEGQAAVQADTTAADLIVIDNLATLTRYGKENEAESWHPMQEWLLSLRRQGKSVLLVHHSNKSGAQRGTSSREDILDTVISLTRPLDYEAEQGARFVVTFEKGRGLFGSDSESFEAAMTVRDATATWDFCSIEDSVAAQVAELRDSGMSYRNIGEELRISKSAAERAYKRHIEQSSG